MPWNNQGGGGNRGPWGQGPGGQQPPNLEELLRQSQDRFKRFLPGGGGAAKIIPLVLLVLVGLWAASGFYRVETSQQGVVLRFGEWVNTTYPGLNYHLPSPIETALTPGVTRVNRIDVGFRSTGELGRSNSKRDVPEESLMLTGDENIVDIDFTVLWKIKNAGEFLFNVQRPETTVKAVAESAMRQIVGRMPIAAALAEGKVQIEQDARDLTQKILDGYKAGVDVQVVKLQKVDPPGAVIDAFRDVQRARADMERQRNEAESYSNDIIPRARGEAEQMIQKAKGYQQEVVARAEGDANRFLAVYKEFSQAREVTTLRLYLETMEQVLRGMSKIIVDGKSSSGVVPYLPLQELQKKTGASK